MSTGRQKTLRCRQPLTDVFTLSASIDPNTTPRKKRLPPFSLRLSADERARLMNEAAGAPLGAYIKNKVLGSTVPVRMRRTGLTIQDRTALAQVLALLGRSRLSSNLNQLAHLANIGALRVTPETEAELSAALSDVRAIRTFLMTALGLKAEAAP